MEENARMYSSAVSACKNIIRTLTYTYIHSTFDPFDWTRFWYYLCIPLIRRINYAITSTHNDTWTHTNTHALTRNASDVFASYKYDLTTARAANLFQIVSPFWLQKLASSRYNFQNQNLHFKRRIFARVVCMNYGFCGDVLRLALIFNCNQIWCSLSNVSMICLLFEFQQV